MGNAAEAAEQGQVSGAERSGQEAERALDGLSDALRARRDSLSGAWKRETLAALDRALSETAALADRQQQVAEALRSGDTGAGPRSAQASVEEGTAAVERQIREALSGNLCRCTGYQNIVAAVRLACGAPSSPRA